MTKIEWTERTWNPIIGCSKISEGCKNCYAEKMSYRLSSMNNKVGEDYKQVISNKRFNGNLVYLEERLEQPAKWKTPSMIFVNSMSDLFHEKISYEKIIRMIAIMEANIYHTFQILTKRPENAVKFFDWYGKYAPTNVWIGVSIEMKKYLNRMEKLRKIATCTRFISFEPLLEDVGELDLTGIDWVIVGGESGYGKRPFNPDWARNILRQCKEQNVKFFMKQIDKVEEIPEDLLIREYPKILNEA